MRRKPLITLYEARRLYGTENTTFARPRYVPEGACEWCGSPLPKGRTSCCCSECSRAFRDATSPVSYNNRGSVGGYRNHIMRRDNYTCQMCGEPHWRTNDYGIPLPTTDGNLDVHHKVRVADGGSDAPDNLVTLCRDCHKRIHSVGEKAESVDFSWQETGELSIEIRGNLSATARYFPSQETIKETAERLARRPLSRSEIEDIQILTKGGKAAFSKRQRNPGGYTEWRNE